MKRTALKTRRAPLKRTALDQSAIRLHRRRTKVAQRIAGKREWAERAARSRCVMCGAGRHVTGHHIIPLQILKRNNVDPALWFDQRNLLPLCMEPSPARCHQRHELWVARVPRAALPAAAYEFAEEVGLAWVLDREYST